MPTLTNSSNTRTKAGDFLSIGQCFGRRIKRRLGGKVSLGLVFPLRLDKTDGFPLQLIIRCLDNQINSL